MTTPAISTAGRFRKKPVEVDAKRWTGDNAAELVDFTGQKFMPIPPEDRGDDPDKDAAVFDELHSVWVPLATGDWIVRGIKGEFYPCVPDVFASTYEPVG